MRATFASAPAVPRVSERPPASRTPGCGASTAIASPIVTRSNGTASSVDGGHRQPRSARSTRRARRERAPTRRGPLPDLVEAAGGDQVGGDQPAASDREDIRLREVAGQDRRRDAPAGHERHVGERTGKGLQHADTAERFRGEELERAQTEPQRGLHLGGGRDAGQRQCPQAEGLVDDRGIESRAHDEIGAQLHRASGVVRAEHRAGADHHIRARAEQVDGVPSRTRAQGHLDRRDAAVDQGVHDVGDRCAAS